MERRSAASLTRRRSLLQCVSLADGLDGGNVAGVEAVVAGADRVVVVLVVVGLRVRGATPNPAGPISGARLAVGSLSVGALAQKPLKLRLQKLPSLEKT